MGVSFLLCVHPMMAEPEVNEKRGKEISEAVVVSKNLARAVAREAYKL